MKTRFHGTIKRLKTEELTTDDLALVDALFPAFRQTDEYFQRWAEDTSVQQITDSTNSTWVHDGRYGRFAGRDLSRGRYFTVCRDASGADGGTLVNELMTYWYFAREPWSDDRLLIPSVIDSSDAPDAAVRRDSPQLLIDAQAYRVKQGLLGTRAKRAGRVRDFLPLSVEEVEIEDVVDLRLPQTQQWFSDHFAKLELEGSQRGTKFESGLSVHHVKFHEPGSFVELLPTLVEPSPGGTAFSQAVGAWLRSNGVAGLVYPSARRDAHLVLDGDTIGFEGWNFVDYRGAPSTEGENLFGGLPHWIRAEEIGVRLTNYGGSGWTIEGAESGENQRFELKRLRVLGKIPEEIRVEDPRYPR